MGSKDEIMTFFGRCRCCLDYGYLKSMWKEHIWEEEREIYGEMLMDVFNIDCESNKMDEHICDSCIVRLRDASHFKKEVISSGQLLQEGFEEEDPFLDSMKIEKPEEEYLGNMSMYSGVSGDAREATLFDIEAKSDYGEIEFLDEDAEIVERTVYKKEIDTESDDDSTRDRSRKRKRHERSSYRNYTQADMKKCLDAIQKEGLTQSEAAKLYNIPTKTVNVKMCNLRSKADTPVDDIKQEKRERAEKQYKFVEEIQKILKMTNCIPFKVKSTRLYCAYCYLRGVCFEDTDDLRAHIFEKHKKERITAIESVLRPFWQNEVLRMDITNLSCTVCEKIINGWNEMFQHMFDVHNIEFDLAYTRLIPYKLSQDFNCALCNEKHNNIHLLDAHMNAHYNNYVCPECGDTYVSLGRIKKHLEIHNTGSYPCQHCGKKFTLKKYRDKHSAMVHERAKTYRCYYCTERFVTEYEKHVHTKEFHKDKIKIINCEICGKIFDWRPNYLSHFKKAHRKLKRYQCSFCFKWFATKHDFKLHEQRHTKTGQHICDVCNKNFVTGQELRSHKRVHNKDK